MPEYPFRTPDGAVIHQFFSMADAPSIGSKVIIAGHECTRIASDCLVNGDPLSKRYPVESVQLPNSICDNGDAKRSPKGRVIIKNAAHHREICRKYGYTLD